MSRSIRPLAEKKLDEEFPSLSSLPKRISSAQAPNIPTSSSPGTSPSPISAKNQTQTGPQPKIQTTSIQLTASEQYSAFLDTTKVSADFFLNTDLSTQDFGHALSSSLNYIPDTPYDANDPRNDGQYQTDQITLGYPVFPNRRLSQPEFLKRYDLSTLFFIFYFSPGSSQQYFAGQELKRREWIYNTKHLKWFHRLSEPTEKTSNFEAAKFEYFDYSNSWCIKQTPLSFEFDLLCD